MQAAAGAGEYVITCAAAGLPSRGATSRVALPSATQPTKVSPGAQKALTMCGWRALAPDSILPAKPNACAALRKLVSAPPTAAHCSCAGTSGWPMSMRATSATVTGARRARSASSAAPASSLPASRAACANNAAKASRWAPRTTLKR